jgi:NAD(P)-dependent dehydrogenase (short-subunit alcohol dehydrogenase family)
MVANAGIAPVGPLLDITEEVLDRLVAVNVKGVLFCYQAAARQMLKQGKGGRLIGEYDADIDMGTRTRTRTRIQTRGRALIYVLACALGACSGRWTSDVGRWALGAGRCDQTLYLLAVWT